MVTARVNQNFVADLFRYETMSCCSSFAAAALKKKKRNFLTMLTGDEWIVWLLLLEDVYDPKKSSSVRCSLPAGREDGVLGRAVPSCEIFRLKLI